MSWKFKYVVPISATAIAAALVMANSNAQLKSGKPTSIVSPQTTSHAYTNRLAQEKSPYLRQHQYNPVDWYPWGEEAFEKARRENKPIFLSVGYSTCHWCHVMERESFENEEVAGYINERFVCIKVDREERPDVDKIYMTFVQSMTGSGGWPMSVWLTPDLDPFYGGTYFPPESRHGRPSFMQVLEHIHNLWTNQHDQLLSSAEDMTKRLKSYVAQSAAATVKLSPSIRDNAAKLFMNEYDSNYGGFGNAPKFPRPSQPSFLLGYGVRSNVTEAVEMVIKTCKFMSQGGIYDHIGGGFARYATDRKWLVPHFEKMLYDNAQLVDLYLDAYLVSNDETHLEVAQDILRYVFRDMTHPNGGFYSAEDADSEGKEGKFYCWTEAEMKQILSPEEFQVAARYFGVTVKGNFIDHSDPDPLPNQNVLSILKPENSSDKRSVLEFAKAKLFAVREKRIRPHLDDKILASWNGMMLGAISRMYGVTGNPQYLKAAEKNLAFLKENFWEAETKTLYHRWRDGERDNVQLLVAYAFLLEGIIDLYQATLKSEYLQFAVDLAEPMMTRFYDQEKGGFWQSVSDGTQIMRIKDDYDGAEPSGNSVAVLALLKLAAITARKDFREAAEKTLELFSQRLTSVPQGVPYMLQAMDFLLVEPKRSVIAGKPADLATQKLIRTANRAYNPEKVILGTQGPVEPFAKTLTPLDSKPTAYVCTGTAYQPPTHDPEELRNLMKL